MIFGIGHDIVEISRIQNLLNTYGNKFALKILTQEEYKIFINHTKQAHYLAKRFAAKEAFAKACNIGLRSPILLKNITILNNAMGKPQFSFDSSILHWLEKHHINKQHLTLSDEKYICSAFVILEQL